jgi:hypothetical protein
LGTGGAGARRLQVPVVGGAGRGGWLGSGVTHGGPTAERQQGRVDSRAAARSEGWPGGERSGTHMGPNSQVARGQAHTWGPDSRAVTRSGTTHGGPMVERQRGRVDSQAAVRSWLDLAGCVGRCVDANYCFLI